jgi:hypothetical protein
MSAGTRDNQPRPGQTVRNNIVKFIKLCVAALVLLAAFVVGASANDADFRMVNKTGYQIDSVFISRTSSNSWGSDVMGKDALDDGAAVKITFPHGGSACKFDIKVKYEDGDTAEWGNVDLCQYETITLFWDGKQTHAVGE